MNVKEAIEGRRAYRSLDPVGISKDLIEDLTKNASLAPSCFNYQPWRFVFVYDRDKLKKVFSAMSRGNEWTNDASMIIAVFSKKELDCTIHGREYYLFDTGMATAFLILRATELGLVAHPIAGYHENEIKKILNIPEEAVLITLINIGKHAKEIKPILSKKQANDEENRPHRMSTTEVAYINVVK